MGTFFGSFTRIGEGISKSTGQKIAWLCNGIIATSLWVLAFALPIFFLPGTTDVLEFHKQTLLFVCASAALLAWLGKMLVERKVELRGSVINVLVLLFAFVYVISTVISKSPDVGFMGGMALAKGGLLTVLSLVAVYFVVVNWLTSVKQVRQLVSGMILGGLVVSVFAVLQGIGVYLFPYDFAKRAGFLLVGTPAALAVYCSFIVTLVGGMLLAPHGGHQCIGKWCALKNWALFVLALIPMYIVAAVAFWPVLVSLLIGSFVLIIYAFLHVDVVQKGIKGIALPILAILSSLFLLFFGFPFESKYPTEVMPSLRTTSQITYATLREYPLFGTGPSTFIYDYSLHKPAEVNEGLYWNYRFDRGGSRVLTLAATTGLFGLLTYLLLVIFVFFAAMRAFIRRDEETWHTMIGVFAGWCVLVAGRFLFSSTMTLEFLFWFSTALLVVTIAQRTKEIDFASAQRTGAFASLCMIVVVVSVLTTSFIMVQRYGAEMAFARASVLSTTSGDVNQIAKELEYAVKRQGRNDVYLRSLANVRLTQAIANGKSALDIKKEDNETQKQFEERQQVATRQKDEKTLSLASDALLLATRATDIDPMNVANWSLLAQIYQNMMGVTEGAVAKAEEAYTKAILLEPTNPALFVELSKVYLFQHEQLASQAAGTKDENKLKELASAKSGVLAKAHEGLTKAIAFKGDYAAAHYQMALVLDKQGKIKEAIERMEAVTRIKGDDIGVWFQLGLLYYQDGRKDAALRVMENVVEASPTYTNARWYLASMYEEKGELDKAISQLKEIIAINPSDAAVKEKLAQLEAKKVPPTAEGLPQPVNEAPKK